MRIGLCQKASLIGALLVFVSIGGCSDQKAKDTAGNSTETTVGEKEKAPGKNSQKKKTLILATNSEPDQLNPLFAEMAASREILFLGQRELTMHNDKWELIPDLAVRIPSVENGAVKLIDTEEKNADGTPKQKMQVTWQIRQDAYWSDAAKTPVTADDFIFAWQIQMDPSQEIIDRDLPERIESMVAAGDDKKTLIVTWKEPFAFFAQYRVHYSLPAHVLKPRYEKPGGGTNNMKKDEYGRKPLSNGPFKFKEWIPGQYITYERNENYSPRPKLDEVTIRIIPNTNAIESALLAGDIDGCTPMGGFTVGQLEDLKKREGENFKYQSVPGLVWAHIDFNLDDPMLAQKPIRQAIMYATNRQGVIDELFYGKYTIAHTFLPPRHWGYHHEVKKYGFDLDKANALLDKTDFKMKKTGTTRVNQKGEKLRIKLSAVGGLKDIENLQQVMQSDFKKVGIELQIDNKPAKVFFGELARYRKFPHLSLYAWVQDPDSWGNTLWQSDMIPSAKNSWKGQNYPGWKNEEVTKILKEVPVVLDEAKRKKMMKNVQEVWAEELPSIPMYFRPVISVVKTNVQNYQPTGTQTPISWNAHLWDI